VRRGPAPYPFGPADPTTQDIGWWWEVIFGCEERVQDEEAYGDDEEHDAASVESWEWSEDDDDGVRVAWRGATECIGGEEED
jgi:hypothetical protein